VWVVAVVVVINVMGRGGGDVTGIFVVLDHAVVRVSELPVAAGAEAVFIGARPGVWGAVACFLGLPFGEPLRTGPLDVSFFSAGPASWLGPFVGVTAGGACDRVRGVGGRDAW